MNSTCCYCGEKASVGANGIPLSIGPGKPLCSTCWWTYWHDIAKSETSVFRIDTGYDGATNPDSLFDRPSRGESSLDNGWLTMRQFDHDDGDAYCARCLEDFAEPGDILCAMCKYEQKREGNNFVLGTIVPIKKSAERPHMPGLKRLNDYIESLAS